MDFFIKTALVEPGIVRCFDLSASGLEWGQNDWENGEHLWYLLYSCLTSSRLCFLCSLCFLVRKLKLYTIKMSSIHSNNYTPEKTPGSCFSLSYEEPFLLKADMFKYCSILWHQLLSELKKKWVCSMQVPGLFVRQRQGRIQWNIYNCINIWHLRYYKIHSIQQYSVLSSLSQAILEQTCFQRKNLKKIMRGTGWKPEGFFICFGDVFHHNSYAVHNQNLWFTIPCIKSVAVNEDKSLL